MTDSYLLTNARIVSSGYPLLKRGCVLVEKGRIVHIGEEIPSSLPVIDAGLLIAGPGLIDMHIHGCGGADSSDANQSQALPVMASYLQSQGITSFQVASFNDYGILCRVRRALLDNPSLAASLTGVYFEGPFVNPRKRGGLGAESLMAYDEAYLEKLLSVRFRGKSLIRTMTIAPEVEGADRAAAILEREGVKVAYGHSAVLYEKLKKRKNLHLTHLYNMMSGLDHHHPGLAISPFLDEKTTCELICDGVHVASSLLDMTISLLKEDQICVISDGMKAQGMGKGKIRYAGQGAYSDGKACYYDDGTLIGSATPISESAALLFRRGVMDLSRFFAFTSANPARVLGLTDRGSLSVGKRADIVLFDDELKVKEVLKATSFEEGN